MLNNGFNPVILYCEETGVRTSRVCYERQLSHTELKCCSTAFFLMPTSLLRDQVRHEELRPRLLSILIIIIPHRYGEDERHQQGFKFVYPFQKMKMTFHFRSKCESEASLPLSVVLLPFLEDSNFVLQLQQASLQLYVFRVFFS